MRKLVRGTWAVLEVLSVLWVLAVVVAGWATWRGGLAWARLRSRRQAVLALLAALVITGLVGGAGTDQHMAPSADVAADGAATSAPRSTSTVTPPPLAPPQLTSVPIEPVTTSPTPSNPASPAPATTVRAPAAGAALAVLATLPVKGRAPKTGYSRDQFGPAWADTDRNGCDPRNDILRRDLTDTVIKAGTHGCKVLAGTAAPEVYTGATVRFEIGGAAEIDIDHVVSVPATLWASL